MDGVLEGVSWEARIADAAEGGAECQMKMRWKQKLGDSDGEISNDSHGPFAWREAFDACFDASSNKRLLGDFVGIAGYE